jgi:exodeoxyribonuclease V beta subunit
VSGWQSLQLAPGSRCLIEASAGTGKTWTIAVLYLRLLLEFGFSSRQIVVTTFTEAAAQELRERLRRRLLWAEAQAAQHSSGIEHPSAADDAAALWLQARWHTQATALADLQRLRLAQAELDHAPISTLHGLCRRILADQPFACGVDFDGGELVASDALLDEVVQDLWRCLQQGADDQPLRLLMEASGLELDIRRLREWLKLGLMPGMQIEAAELAELAADPALADQLDSVAELPGVFAKNAVLPRALRALADSLRAPHGPPPGESELGSLCKARGLTGVLKAAQNDSRVLAATAAAQPLGEQLAARAQQLPLRLLQVLVADARARLQVLLAQRRLQSFDSLLETVDAALSREAARADDARPLADALHAAWPVALVDEFQDTDALQYAILDRIYREADGSPRGRLLMIGDPKQAIYRFRGGDIHAYQRAAEQADEYLTLDVNQRSTRALVAGCSELFERAGSVLSTDPQHSIHYLPVSAAGRADTRPYTQDGQPPRQALIVHYQAEAPDAQPARRSWALRACAAQIVELLNDPGQRIDGRRLSPGDLAVLLPSARDIASLRALLDARGVPCVSTSRDNVFGQDCARELQVLLYGVLHNHDAGALRAAAATRLWGARLSELRAWEQQPEALQHVAAQFRGLAEDWRERGVAGLIERLLELLAPRALQTRQGERLLTDLRHLGELLQDQAEHLGGPEELLAWLDAQRRGLDGIDEGSADERQLRIESQQPRLRLLTLHASKGLEFPIVLLPLLWAQGGRNESAPFRITDGRAERPRLGFDDAAKALHRRDLQDERFRLLYVALTRAVHACHVFALSPLRPKDGRSRSPACEGVDASALDVLLARAGVGGDEFDPAQLQSIGWREGWRDPGLVRYVDEQTHSTERSARPLQPLPRRVLESKHSFTGLSRAGRAWADGALDPEAAALDELQPAAPGLELDGAADSATAVDDTAVDVSVDEAAHPELLALSELRGAGFGNALHTLLETRVIGQPLSAQRAHVRAALQLAGLRQRDFRQHGFEGCVERVAQRLDAALAAPLGLSQAPQVSLADVPAVDQRAEMGFEFALPEISLAALAQACAEHGEPDLIPPGGRRVAGLMTGKIDLVLRVQGRFHVLDYKGNWLGERVSDYSGDALTGHMDASQYRFQALLYTLALDRYLAQRLGAAYSRQQQLGECVYLFLRAAGLAPGAGVWRQRFSDGLISAVQAALAGMQTLELSR